MSNILTVESGAGPLSETLGMTHITHGPDGNGFLARARIAVTGSTAADAPIFSMKLDGDSTNSAYIQWIDGSILFHGTAANSYQGLYWEHHSGTDLSGGTAITPVKLRGASQDASDMDIRFHTGALTGAATYAAAPFHGKAIPISGTSGAGSLFGLFGGAGLLVTPDQGIAARLTATSVTGLVIDLTVCWVER